MNMQRILLVDDDKELTEHLSMWLKHEKFIVETAHSGMEALELMGSAEFELIMLDWTLPDISGCDVCRQYRNNGGNAPILMYSGRTESEDKAAGLAAGASEFISKPFHPAEITQRIRSMLS